MSERLVFRVPSGIRRILKRIIPHNLRRRLHDVDYHVAHLLSMYQHHLVTKDDPSVREIMAAMMEVTRKWRDGKTVFCYPGLPGPGFVFYRVSLELGYTFTQNRESDFDVAMKWWVGTTDPHPGAFPVEADQIINANATDIRKSKVCAEFEATFGYPLALNPKTHEGPMVRKSETNAAHDGTVVQGPIGEPDPGFVYQRLVDCETEQGVTEDIRVPIFGYQIPFVYLRYKRKKKRFGHAGQSVIREQVVSPTDIFSDEEVEKILAFCESMGLDCGELDVLRDRPEDRIYVVDVNTTPTGPSFMLSSTQTKWVCEQMAQAFEDMLT